MTNYKVVSLIRSAAVEMLQDYKDVYDIQNMPSTGPGSLEDLLYTHMYINGTTYKVCEDLSADEA